jgi:hypothetical protein
LDKVKINIRDTGFANELNTALPSITELYDQLYAKHENAEEAFNGLIQSIVEKKR